MLLRGYKNAVNKNKLTGNIEIFEVDCNCDVTPSIDGLFVNDTEQIWQATNDVQIFRNPMYEMSEIIAPGSSNSYNFAINNKSDCEMIYGLTFTEDNKYNINMKYRIKRNNVYYSEEWKSVTELNLEEFVVAASEKDNFILEWKWFDSKNDTEIGSINNSNYGLEVKIVGRKNI